jgi:deoxyadenosine/deoxycytidine kinase
LEGNIGAGKTTLARGLYEEFKKLGLKTVHIQEPVGAWVDFHGTNLLGLLYENIERWAFTFQTNALMYMTDCDKRAVEYSKKGYIVIKERSSFSVRRIFNEQMRAFMTPAEIKILSELCDKITDPRETAVAAGTINDVTLYLRTDPETCYSRKLKRRRPEEISKNNLVNGEYLKRLHDIHEVAVSSPISKVIFADGTRFDAQDPKSVRISGSGDFVFETLIGGIDIDQPNRILGLVDEWTPEGDLIAIAK